MFALYYTGEDVLINILSNIETDIVLVGGVGDVVKEGDILAEIETDKATMEFESFHEGTLLFIGINVGETAKVDTLLAVIGDPNSDYKTAIDNFGINGETYTLANE